MDIFTGAWMAFGILLIVWGGYAFFAGKDKEESFRMAVILILIGGVVDLVAVIAIVANYLYRILLVLEKLPVPK